MYEYVSVSISMFMWGNFIVFEKRLSSEDHIAFPYTPVPIYLFNSLSIREERGGLVVKALRYKPEGCGIDSRWCHWNFSLT
jgi:hypothetical protein